MSPALAIMAAAVLGCRTGCFCHSEGPDGEDISPLPRVATVRIFDRSTTDNYKYNGPGGQRMTALDVREPTNSPRGIQCSPGGFLELLWRQFGTILCPQARDTLLVVPNGSGLLNCVFQADTMISTQFKGICGQLGSHLSAIEDRPRTRTDTTRTTVQGNDEVGRHDQVPVGQALSWCRSSSRQLRQLSLR